jgi:lysophospholipase L1-like esterase
VASFVLAVAAVVVFLGGLELSLRAFVDLAPVSEPANATRLFVRDAELGWKLRPGAEDEWGGVRVRINDKGMRGPELPYAKPAGARRVLYLGDSVAFGFGIARHEDTFPFRVADLLAQDSTLAVETVNTGVGGYSPWQFHGVLASEGIRYAPDLVVVSFVLNDVTEKFELLRFGGTSEGHQLLLSVRSRGQVGRRLVSRLRFGEDVAQGARELVELRAHQLALEPDSPRVKRAWDVTLANLAKIFSFCSEREIPALLVAFPYTFQLRDPSRFGAPQQVLHRFAAEHDVAYLDLLPHYAARVRPGALRAWFLDDDHPTERGHDLAARAMAERIRAEAWLRPGSAPDE